MSSGQGMSFAELRVWRLYSPSWDVFHHKNQEHVLLSYMKANAWACRSSLIGVFAAGFKAQKIMARSTKSLKQTIASKGIQLSPDGCGPTQSTHRVRQHFWFKGQLVKVSQFRWWWAVLLPLFSLHKLTQVSGRGSQAGLTELLVSKAQVGQPQWEYCC